MRLTLIAVALWLGCAGARSPGEGGSTADAGAALPSPGGEADASVAALPTTASPSPSPLFREEAVISLRIEGPFARLNKERTPPPDNPGVHLDQPKYAGKLSFTNADGARKSVDITVRARGSSSLLFMRFAKLKVKIAGDQEKGTPFDHAGSFKIGTHGNENPKIEDGRLYHETATHREGFAYQALELLGVLSLKSRPARITYFDTETQEELTRDAVLIEDPDAAAERLGGKEIDEPPPPEQSLIGTLSPEEQARLELAQALLGNWDYRLPDARRPLGHNLLPIRKSDGGALLLPQDFDLASFVSGVPSGLYWLPERFADRSDRFKQLLSSVVELRKRLPTNTLGPRVQELRDRIPEVLIRLRAAPVDDAGKENIAAHLTAFSEAAPLALTFPLLREGAKAFSDAQGKVPLGTYIEAQPVEVVESVGDFTHVRFLKGFGVNAPREAWLKREDVQSP